MLVCVCLTQIEFVNQIKLGVWAGMVEREERKNQW